MNRRGFRLLWLASTTSALGDGMRWIALPLLAARQYADPWTISLITAAEHAPWLVFSLLAGVLADRYDRRTVIWCTDLARAGLMAVFTVAVGLQATPIGLIATLGFLLTCGETLVGAASGGLLPSLVRPAERAEANGRLQAGVQVADTLVGSSLGAVLFGVVAIAPFALDAATFVGSAVCVALLLPPRPDPDPGDAQSRTTRSLRAEVAEGVRFLRGSRLLRGLCLLQAVTNAAFTGLLAVLVLFAARVLGLHAIGFGLLVAAFALGGVAGGLATGRLTAVLGARRCLLFAVAGSAVCTALLGLARQPATAGVLAVLLGVTSTMAGSLTAALRQEVVPDAFLGRVTSTFRLVAFGVGPLAALGGGALADAFGLRTPFLTGAALIALGLLVTWRTINVPVADCRLGRWRARCRGPG